MRRTILPHGRGSPPLFIGASAPPTTFFAFLVNEFFDDTAVASDSGVFVLQLRYLDWPRNDGLKAKAVDRQTGQVCDAFAWYRD